jgi:hypothetical protein
MELLADIIFLLQYRIALKISKFIPRASPSGFLLIKSITKLFRKLADTPGLENTGYYKLE